MLISMLRQYGCPLGNIAGAIKHSLDGSPRSPQLPNGRRDLYLVSLH
jgi:hypothetical protein